MEIIKWKSEVATEQARRNHPDRALRANLDTVCTRESSANLVECERLLPPFGLIKVFKSASPVRDSSV